MGSRRRVDGDLGCKLARSRPCPRAAGEMKRACLGGQNAQRSKDGLRCLSFITRSLLRSTARGGKGRTGRCGEARLPVLRDSLPVRVADSVRTTHDPGSWGQRAYLPRYLPTCSCLAGAHGDVVTACFDLILLLAWFRSVGRWEEQLGPHPARLPRGVCLFPPGVLSN